MKSLEEVKRALREHKEEIRRKYGVMILGVFGSVARGCLLYTSPSPRD